MSPPDRARGWRRCTASCPLSPRALRTAHRLRGTSLLAAPLAQKARTALATFERAPCPSGGHDDPLRADLSSRLRPTATARRPGAESPSRGQRHDVPRPRHAKRRPPSPGLPHQGRGRLRSGCIPIRQGRASIGVSHAVLRPFLLSRPREPTREGPPRPGGPSPYQPSASKSNPRLDSRPASWSR